MPIQVGCKDIGINTHLARPNNCLDENRAIVVDGEYIIAIIRLFSNPDLIHVAIPVIYNICMDYGRMYFPKRICIL